MASSAHIRRVVFSHDWQDLAEWAHAVDDLADFSDDEIDELVAEPQPQSVSKAA